MGEWTFDPLQLAPLALASLAYARRARTLRARGTPVARARVVSFSLFVLLAFLALASPVHELGEERLFSAHMLQHVVLGDLAPLAFVIGLTGPILRPVIALPVVERLRALAHPLVALPVWALNLFLWHIPYLYEAALHHDSVHALQHLLFVTCGALMWAPVIETLPAPLWFGTGW